MKNYFKTSPLGIVMGYLLGILIAGLFGSVVIYSIAQNKFNFTQDEILAIINAKDQLTPTEDACLQFINSWINLLQYALMFILIGFFARDYLKQDFIDLFSKESKLSKKRYIIMAIIAVVAVFVMMCLSLLTEYLVSIVTNGAESTSNNQASIVKMIESGYGALLFIAVVLFAPVVEELLYRKAIFKFLEKKNVWVPLMVSSLIFALPHMLSAQENFLAWFLLFANYLSSGIILGLIYVKSNKNIYLSILCHMLNNLLAFLVIVL